MSFLVNKGTVGSINYSTVGRSSCLILQWMKAQSHQSRIVNVCKSMYSSCTKLCVFRMCVCVWVGGGGGGGDLMCARARSSQTTPVIKL